MKCFRANRIYLNGNSNKTLRSQHKHIRNNFIFSRQDITQEIKTLKFQNVSHKQILGGLKK